jgi:hypothetical protein
MRTTWLLLACLTGPACGSATNGGGGPLPGGGESTSAQAQLALVPAESLFVVQGDVARLFRRSTTHAGEQLLARLLAEKDPEVNFTCIFDLAETVGWATGFFVDREDGEDGAALLLETTASPESIADCIERASAGEVRRVPAPPELSDAIVVGEHDDRLAVVGLESGIVAVATPGTTRMLLAGGPVRRLPDDPFYRDLLTRVGHGDVWFAYRSEEPRWEYEGGTRVPAEPRTPDGTAAVLRAGTDPPEGRAVFTSPDAEDVGELVDDFQEARGEMREKLELALRSLDGAPADIELDLDRVSRTVDILLQSLRGLRVVVEENAAVFEATLPAGTDVPQFLADLGYTAVAWIALEEW